MNIDDARALKLQLEFDIEKLVKTFEKDTGLIVDEILPYRPDGELMDIHATVKLPNE